MKSKKEKLRQQIWDLLSEKEVGAFPFPLEGRIPNFKGSNEAARRLAETSVFRSADTVKANPDAPQRKARELALRQGKRLFMAVPRLRSDKPFMEINPGDNTDPSKAVTIKGSKRFGIPRTVGELPFIDLIIAGSVAVHRDGRRLGKGGGYSDLEFALAAEDGKIGGQTLVVTTVHPLQIVDSEIPFESHDVPVDLIVTPHEVIETNTRFQRPQGIIADILSDSYLEEIPALAEYQGN
ncbi:MAG: 5-formyltetrahydrofolate cyclo-ligase [Balneolaceae bacterium]|nr:5-formyltetrahydrofolate cyclo-ligase [Balneolaceae bacterium]